jgi:hypothetical protein
MLQMPGEHCGVAEGNGVYHCCQGLVCEDPSTGQPLVLGSNHMGFCTGAVQCPPPQPPNWQPLTTVKLRWIAAQNGIGAGQTGIQQSRTIGVEFEKWVLTTIGVYPAPPNPGRNTMSFMSQARKTKTGGLPASVIPEYVTFQYILNPPSMLVFPKSVFYEVKAVTNPITLGTSNWQTYGLLDVARQAMPPGGLKAAPAVIFITTGSTTVSTGVVAQANDPMWNVAIWQVETYYDANSPNPSNPNLSLGKPQCLNPGVYGGTLLKPITGSWPASQLTSPTTPSAMLVVPGDPDPAEVD